MCWLPLFSTFSSLFFFGFSIYELFLSLGHQPPTHFLSIFLLFFVCQSLNDEFILILLFLLNYMCLLIYHFENCKCNLNIYGNGIALFFSLSLSFLLYCTHQDDCMFSIIFTVYFIIIIILDKILVHTWESFLNNVILKYNVKNKIVKPDNVLKSWTRYMTRHWSRRPSPQLHCLVIT